MPCPISPSALSNKTWEQPIAISFCPPPSSVPHMSLFSPCSFCLLCFSFWQFLVMVIHYFLYKSPTRAWVYWHLASSVFFLYEFALGRLAISKCVYVFFLFLISYLIWFNKFVSFHIQIKITILIATKLTSYLK